MPQVAEWLQKIITAIILAGFLEMLLPNNELKSVTKMIMGLLIMMMLIQPLIKLFDLPQTVSWSLPSISEPQSDSTTRQIIERGLRLRESWTAGFKDQNKKILEGKLKNIIGLIDEVRLENLALNYQGDRLSKAVIKIKRLKRGPLEQVVKNSMQRKVIDSVQLLTNLTEDQIEVIWDGGNQSHF
jgi:stage III sporulation protein AF